MTLRIPGDTHASEWPLSSFMLPMIETVVLITSTATLAMFVISWFKHAPPEFPGTPLNK